MKLAKYKDSFIRGLFAALIFVGAFLFLYVAHPLILADTDDWYYASYWRRPLPIPGSFNGIKVFPETLMPFASLIGANLVLPVMGDYIMSLALSYAVVGAVFVTIYASLAGSVVKRTFGISEFCARMISLLFLMLHFLIYKNDWTGNRHLLWTHDVTCFFHYVLSALLNAILVMAFIKWESDDETSICRRISSGKLGFLKGGAIILVSYLAVFSNMFGNIVLATYAGVHALIRLTEILGKDKKSSLKDKLIRWWSDAWLFIGIVLAWFAAVLIQTTDPRNGNARGQGATGSFSGAIQKFMGNFTSVNKMAALALVLILIACIAKIVFIKRKRGSVNKNFKGLSLEIIASGILTSVYLILLSGVASPGYIARLDVMVGVFFYIFLEFMLILGFLLARADAEELRLSEAEGRAALILPLVVFILVAQTLNYCKSYSDFNSFGFSWELEKKIADDIISQFVAADEAGDETLDLYVPVNENAQDRWPYPSYCGSLISDALHRHGIISRSIEAVAVYDPARNAKLGVEY